MADKDPPPLPDEPGAVATAPLPMSAETVRTLIREEVAAPVAAAVTAALQPPATSAPGSEGHIRS